MQINYMRKIISFMSILTCVCDALQLFGAYLESLLSGSANKYSPPETTKLNITKIKTLIINK